jgi:hypothetical protein
MRARESKPRRPPKVWEALPDDALLDWRICDLKLKIRGTELEAGIERLYRELEARRIRIRPHCWLSQEWFSPDGIPGIAIPFYLAHRRLRSLERRYMHEVEGGNAHWLMRILRHEAGHAVDTAYRLRRHKNWREVFGPASVPYPDTYRPRPGSRRFVQHLGGWYAQAHPTEDFAETFAVWLKPHSPWRREYADWAALAKLEFIDDLMRGIGAAKPLVTDSSTIEEAAEDTRTLRQHYARKLERYRLPRRSGADALLLEVFTTAPRSGAARAAGVLRAMQNPASRRLLCSDGFNDYLVHQVLHLMIGRCEALNLHVRGAGRGRALEPQLRRLVARLAGSYEARQLPRVPL